MTEDRPPPPSETPPPETPPPETPPPSDGTPLSSDARPPAEAQPSPDAQAGIPAPPQPPPSPLEVLPLSASRILSLSFDLLVGGRTELRRGSLYIGLVLLLTVGPLVLLLWGF